MIEIWTRISFPESLLKARKSATILILSEDAITIHAGAVRFAWIAMHPTLALSAMSIRLQNAPQPTSMPSRGPMPSDLLPMNMMNNLVDKTPLT